jgi:hypothetical protein
MALGTNVLCFIKEHLILGKVYGTLTIMKQSKIVIVPIKLSIQELQPNRLFASFSNSYVFLLYFISGNNWL